MKIGLDAKRAFHNRTGLGNYARTLIQNLTVNYPLEQYVYFTPSENSIYAKSFSDGQIISPSGNNPFWRSFGIIRDILKSKVDLYHGLSNELPFGIQKSGMPTIVTIHDVIFDIVKEDFPWHDRLVYRTKTKKCINESSKIIAISEATKKDLITRFGADPGKISVIYQPVDAQFNQDSIQPDELSRIKGEYNLPGEFMLYVGALMKRKNILPMIQAWELIQDKIPLLIFGDGHQYKKEIQDYIRSHHLEDDVQLRPPVPFHDLPALYRLSECVLYPSLYEGFGLPVLEALACGSRVVTSSVSSMPEAGGELPVYIHPESIDSIASGMQRSLEQSRPDPVQLSDHLAQFESANVTQQIMNLYREVVRK